MSAPFRVALLLELALLSCTSCRRRTERAAPTTITPEPSVSSTPSSPPSSVIASDASSLDAPPKPIAAPKPPVIACTPDARLRFAKPPPDDTIIAPPNAGPDGFSCSPFKTGDSPLELTMAPGTLLQFSLDTELSDDVDAGDAGDFHTPSAPITFGSAGLPKGAWIDPAAQALKYRVAGKEGDAFAFSLAAYADFPEGKRCVTTSMVVRVKDDDFTRRAQAGYLNREAGASRLAQSLFVVPSASPEFDDFDRRMKCGEIPVVPIFRDADGDGLADAIFAYPPRGGGNPREVDVFLRRGDTFSSVGSAIGDVEHAADGATFVFDRFSASSWVQCSLTMNIARVFANRVEKIMSVDSNAKSREDGSCKGSGLELTRSGGDLIGFTDTAIDDSGKVTKRAWRWDGKHFVVVP